MDPGDFLKSLGENLEKLYNDLFKSRKFNDSYDKYRVTYIVYHLMVEEKIDFYGYHGKEEKFIKIFVYDPKYIKPLSKILSSGLIMNIQFQIYEVFSPKFYILNFLGTSFLLYAFLF